uniref:astacin-like metalloendopeptidase isoform X2 n=1 Tax=Pristiophorus japonicus TaxID=55135 RepID=UPI00398F23BA
MVGGASASAGLKEAPAEDEESKSSHLDSELSMNRIFLMDNMNSTLQGGLKRENKDTSESDVFSIILEANKELLKRTGKKIIQYGDVLVGTTRNAMICNNEPRSCLWPSSDDGNVYVPYMFEADYTESQKQAIKKSLDEISSVTCVKFYHRRKSEPAYISIISGAGCYSYVGYAKSKRKLSLQISSCLNFGVIAHEFLHAIGFQHEHCRSDRDKYVKIMLENVEEKLQFNFNLMQTNNLGTTYDYGSVMHYGKTAFTKNGLITMLPIPDPNVELGQRRGLSTKDVLKINKLYNCDVCGNMLVAKSGSFTSPNFPGHYPSNSDCKWIIRARDYFKILLEFSTFNVQEFAACIGDYLTIYDGANNLAKILDGPNCGAENPAAISTQRELLITFTSSKRMASSGFSATYRFITCGTMLLTSKGRIESRSQYAKDLHCFWVLLIRRKYQITLKLEELKFKDTNNSADNKLVIYDAAKSPPVILGKYHGQLSSPVDLTSFGRTIIIEFRHNRSRPVYGFKISYKSIIKILLQFLEPLMRGVTTIMLLLCHASF